MGKTASKQVDDLINSLGGGTPPTNTAVRGFLVKIQSAISDLESGSGSSNLTQENEALKATLETAKAELEACKTNSTTQINVLRAELDALLKDKAGSEEKEKINLPPEQMEILRALKPPEIEKLNLSRLQNTIGENRADPFASVIEISRAIPHGDETVFHLQNLERLELAKRGFTPTGELIWFRTISGNKRVIAERLASGTGEVVQKDNPNLPEPQFEILRVLSPIAIGVPMTIFEICDALKVVCSTDILEDEAVYHVKQLHKLGHVSYGHNEMGRGAWSRSTKGNELVIARRLAEPEKSQKAARGKFSDLAPMEEGILLMLVGEDNGLNASIIYKRLNPIQQRQGVTLAKTKYMLESLKKRNFVVSTGEEYEVLATEDSPIVGEWKIGEAGSEYLAERDKL